MTILATDDFTRANNADLGTNWDEVTGDKNVLGFDINANTAIPHDVTEDSSETNNAATWPNDQYSKVTLANSTADGAGIGSGPSCRMAGGATKTQYRLVVNASGYELGRFDALVFTSLSTGTGTTFAAADTAGLEVRTNGANCDWILKKNGTQFASGTDTTPIASGKAGIGYSSTSTTAALSAWEGGSFDGPGLIDPAILI
jgi:hypothetical protein